MRLTTRPYADENNTQPGWTPDGASIVFRTNRADPSRTSPTSGSWTPTAATNARCSSSRATSATRRCRPTAPGSPTRRATTRGNADLWIANADGSGAQLIYDSGEDDSAPAWSPDSTKLAFETHGAVGGIDGDIFVLDLATGAVDAADRRPARAPIHDEGPAWSPDGTMIAFTSERADPNGDIWIMQADGATRSG